MCEIKQQNNLYIYRKYIVCYLDSTCSDTENILLENLIQKAFLSKIQNRTIEKTGKKILLLYGKISR